MYNNISPRWLIGGPARCGKSALVELLAQEKTSLAAMQVDALLHLNKDIGPFHSDAEATAFLRTYLQRPRFMDAQKKKTRCPLDDFPDDLDQVIANVAPHARMNGLETLAATFDTMAQSQKKNGWVILDLHPELYFRSYAEKIPGLKLLVCLRDPLEAITASLFWRPFPDRPEQFKRLLRYTSSLWRLAASAALSLRQAYPSQVNIISSNEMFEGKLRLPSELSIATDAFSTLFKGTAYFSARKSGDDIEFYCPDGRWHKLLDHGEVATIERWRCRWWTQELFVAPHGTGVSVPGGYLSSLVGRHSSQYKVVLDVSYSPLKTLHRWISKIKHIQKKIG